MHHGRDSSTWSGFRPSEVPLRTDHPAIGLGEAVPAKNDTLAFRIHPFAEGFTVMERRGILLLMVFSG